MKNVKKCEECNKNFIASDSIKTICTECAQKLMEKLYLNVIAVDEKFLHQGYVHTLSEDCFDSKEDRANRFSTDYWTLRA